MLTEKLFVKGDRRQHKTDSGNDESNVFLGDLLREMRTQIISDQRATGHDGRFGPMN